MSLPFIRIIDLRAEGEGAIREAWLPPPPHTHSESIHTPHGPQVVPMTMIRMEGRIGLFKCYMIFFKSPICPEMKGSELFKP